MTDKVEEISILDIWESLPDEGKEIIGESCLLKIKEAKKAKYAKHTLPEKWHKYYDPHFSLMGHKADCFIGLVCRSCNQWIEYGHIEACPAKEVMGDFDYQAAHKIIEDVMRG